MSRSMSGSKAQYHYLTPFVISDFNEWRVLLPGPDTAIQGTRQFSEESGRRYALRRRAPTSTNQRHEDLPHPPPEWARVAGDTWLVWR